MQLNAGNISMCLNVGNLQRSIEFYQRLGFSPQSMHLDEGWAILHYGKFELGLFEGHIASNLINLRGADLYELENELRARGIELTGAAHIEHDGSQALNLLDPDGNVLYFNTFPDEHQVYLRQITQPQLLCEVILYVRDMATQVAFYRDVMGFAIDYPSASADYSQEYWVTFATGTCTLALHGGGLGRIGQDAPKAVYLVHNLPQARQRLMQLGVAMTEPHSPAPGVQVSNGTDPEGNSFSLESRS